MNALKRTISMSCALMVPIAALAQPANDGCGSAASINVNALPYLSPVTDISAASPPGEYGACAPIGYSLWYKLRILDGNQFFVSACPDRAPGVTVANTVIQVYLSDDGTCDALSLVACADDLCGLRADLTFNAFSDTTYYIQVGQWGTEPPHAGEDMLQVYVSTPVPLPPDRWVEDGDAGELVADAQEVRGAGPLSSIQGTLNFNDVDLYLIEICDPQIFSATTRGGATIDTQLFLFDAQGQGIACDDDTSEEIFQSTLTGRFVPSPGRYLLAVNQYNRDPRDSADQLLWLNSPFNIERAPDGDGARNPLDHWGGISDEGGTYAIRLTGAAFPGGCGGGTCPPCAADFNQDGGVDGADVEAFFITWESGSQCGDVNQDGGVDGADVEGFFLVWERGGC